MTATVHLDRGGVVVLILVGWALIALLALGLCLMAERGDHQEVDDDEC